VKLGIKSGSLLVFLSACLTAYGANIADGLAQTNVSTDIQFTISAPHSARAEIIRRFRVSPPDYDLSQEKFRLLMPADRSTNKPWGLFVWISPSDRPSIPDDWKPVLAKRRLLSIGAYNSGNPRNTSDRIRLALDAAYNLQQRFKIDPKRVYVSGFSGGGRIASILGVAYADVFSGAIPVCGVDFFASVPAGDGKYFPASYSSPESKILTLARKNSRFVLITGENDMNRTNTTAVYEYGFKRYGLSHVRCIEVPQMGHTLPSAKVLETAIEFLDGEPSAPSAQPRFK
jgi:predicted esterase